MNKTPMKASDPNDLERRILDPNIAKSEAEWWAKSRIEELERELAAEQKRVSCKELIERLDIEPFTPPRYSEQLNNYLVNLCEKLEHEHDALRAEIAELVVDAARYRHLRQDENFCVDEKAGEHWEPVHYEQLDAALDAALAKVRKP